MRMKGPLTPQCLRWRRIPRSSQRRHTSIRAQINISLRILHLPWSINQMIMSFSPIKGRSNSINCDTTLKTCSLTHLYLNKCQLTMGKWMDKDGRIYLEQSWTKIKLIYHWSISMRTRNYLTFERTEGRFHLCTKGTLKSKKVYRKRGRKPWLGR